MRNRRGRADKLRRLDWLDGEWPTDEGALEELYPDIGAAGIGSIAEAVIAAMLAAGDRLDDELVRSLSVAGDDDADGPPEFILRVGRLAAEDQVARVRSGDRSVPRYGSEGPDPDPGFPATIDTLICRARSAVRP